MAILEAELADYKRRKEEEEEAEEGKSKEGFVEEAEYNQIKIQLDEARMHLQTAELERKQLQVGLVVEFWHVHVWIHMAKKDFMEAPIECA